MTSTERQESIAARHAWQALGRYLRTQSPESEQWVWRWLWCLTRIASKCSDRTVRFRIIDRVGYIRSVADSIAR